MAIKGLSTLIMAKYANVGNAVTYANAAKNEKMAEYSLELNQTDDNPLYLDNAISEMDSGTFQSGTLTLTTGDLSQANSVLILGVKQKTGVSYKTGKTVDELVFDDERKPQVLGVGLVELHQVNNKDVYRAIWLNKVTFNLPNDAAVTKGAAIEWQTKEITGTVMRSDEITTEAENNVSYVHPWKTEADFDNEQDAYEYLLFKGGANATPSEVV